MANIFQCESKVARCVREWDRLLREREWVDTDVFASIFSYATISGNDMLGYEKAIKKAKREIRTALAEQGMSLRESRSAEDNRKILSAYPEHSEDPLHNLRIMAIIDNAMRCSRALHLTYAPSYHESEEHIFHPQYLRVYNGRQYVYGVYKNEEENKGLSFIALPVDRILIAELFKEVSYRRGKPADYEKMMRNVLGEAVVNDIDTQVVAIVRKFTDTFATLAGQNEVKRQLRSILWIKYKIKDNEVFEKAYKYIEMYY